MRRLRRLRSAGSDMPVYARSLRSTQRFEYLLEKYAECSTGSWAQGAGLLLVLWETIFALMVRCLESRVRAAGDVAAGQDPDVICALVCGVAPDTERRSICFHIQVAWTPKSPHFRCDRS